MFVLTYTFRLKQQITWIYLVPMPHKRGSKLRLAGQASVEYLLTLTGVLIAFGGASILFNHQVNRYLSFLYDLITLPF